MKILDKFKKMIPEKVKHFVYRNIIRIIAAPTIEIENIDLTKSIVFCKDRNIFTKYKFLGNNYIEVTKYSLNFREKNIWVNIKFTKGIDWIPKDYILYINNNLSNTIRMLYNSFININKLSLENSNYCFGYNENELFMNHYMMKILNNRGL